MASRSSGGNSRSAIILSQSQSLAEAMLQKRNSRVGLGECCFAVTCEWADGAGVGCSVGASVLVGRKVINKARQRDAKRPTIHVRQSSLANNRATSEPNNRQQAPWTFGMQAPSQRM